MIKHRLVLWHWSFPAVRRGRRARDTLLSSVSSPTPGMVALVAESGYRSPENDGLFFTVLRAGAGRTMQWVSGAGRQVNPAG